MDFSFYLLLTLACMVLLLAMWACAAAGTSKWGPDLTLELPAHILQEALFGPTKPVEVKEQQNDPVPSAPCEKPSAPLLCNEQRTGMSKASIPVNKPPVPMNKPPVPMNKPPLLCKEQLVRMNKPPVPMNKPSLLSNEQPVAKNKPPIPTNKPQLKTYSPSVSLNMDTAVRVLPPIFEPFRKAKPVYHKFSTEEPA